MNVAVKAKGIEFDGFNRVEFEAVKTTVGKYLTASDAAINAKVVEFDPLSFNSPEFGGFNRRIKP